MIVEFVLASLLICEVLYLPGFLILRSARISCWYAVAFAPFVSIPLYCILGIAYEKAGIFASGMSIGLPVLVLALVVFVLSSIVKHRKKAAASSAVLDRLGLIPLLYLGVGIVVYAVFYLNALPSLEHVAESYDNIYHYNLIRSFVDSGIWSSLNTSVYLDVETGCAAAFLEQGGYYPAAWHVITSFPVSILNVPVGVAVNATNFVFVAVAFSLAACLFVWKIFDQKKLVLVVGAFFFCSFGAFPWVLLAQWPLFPYLISLALVPLLCVAFIMLIEPCSTRRQRLIYGLLFIAGVITEVFCQPSSVFAAAVILAPFLVVVASKGLANRFARGSEDRKGPKDAKSRGVRIVSGAVVVLLIAGAWYVAFRLPFLQSTVNYYWAPILSESQAIASSLSLSLAVQISQYGLGVLVLLGCAYIVLRMRDNCWLIFSYFLSIVLFIIAASVGDFWIKHFLTGFWYTDPYRVAAIAGIAGIPLAIAGVYALCLIAQKALNLFGLWRKRKHRFTLASSAIIAVICVVVYSPVLPGTSTVPMFKHIGNIAGELAARFGPAAFDDSEKDFVQRAKEYVQDDDVVLNMPYDGSVMAYGLSDFPIYSRSIVGYGASKESEESAILREGLSRLASDEEVQDAIRRSSADYVLVLTKDQTRFSFVNSSRLEYWKDFLSLNDQTPGLELVLSDGDMKLYKIVLPE